LNRNEQNEGSDIDLIVVFKKGMKPCSRFFKLSEYLEQFFEKDVDLLTEKRIRPYMT